MRIVCVIGPPGCGKSTALASVVATGSRIALVQPGAWLRQCRDYGGDFGHYIANNWKNDVLEPLVIEHVTETVQLLVEADKERESALAAGDAATTVLIDGYPRSEREARHASECMFATLVYFEHTAGVDAERALLRQRADERQRGNDDSALAFDKRYDHYCDARAGILEKFAPQYRTCLRYDDTTTQQGCADALASAIANAVDCLPPPPMVASVWLRISDPLWRPSNDDVPAVFERVTERERATVIQQQQRLAGRARAPRQFCGTHPVSLNRDNMRRILRYPYLVAIKADGLRYACVVRDHGRLYFLNRRLDVYRLRDHPPTLNHSRYDDTLLDGELCVVHDALAPGGGGRRASGTPSYGSAHSAVVYLVLDVFSWCGTNVMRAPLIERLSHSVPLGRDMFSASLPFRPQEYVDRTQIKLLRNRAHTLPFSGHSDGYILVPARLPMRVGTDFNLFKYKSLMNNTVDVLYDGGKLYVVKTPKHDGASATAAAAAAAATISAAVDAPAREDDAECADVCEPISSVSATSSGVTLTPFNVGALHSSYATNTDAFAAGTILECAPTLGGDGAITWVPVRIRGGDKSSPNSDWVAAAVVDSVRDNITEAELIEYAQRPSVSPASVPSPPRVGGGSKRTRLLHDL